MHSDAIVDEVRAIRDAIAREQNYDIAAIVASLIRQQEARRQRVDAASPEAPQQGDDADKRAREPAG